MKKTSKNQLLWSLDLPDRKELSYLFGTMHVKDKRAYGMLDLVYQKILACTAFATEFHLEEIQHQAGENIMDLPADLSLADLIRPKHLKKVAKYFYRLTGMDLNFFRNAQPIMITNLMAEKILSDDRPISLDHHLWKFADQHEKILLGIETFEEQLEILAKIPLDYQADALVKAVKNIKQFRKQLTGMADTYARGDIQKLHKSSKKSLGKLRNLMLYDRNRIMADRIATYAGEQSIFVAVGAGHLGGKKGVVKLLKDKGITMKVVGLGELNSDN